MVTAGDVITRIESAVSSMTVREVFRLRQAGGTRAEYERASQLCGLSPSWRAVFEKRLSEMDNCRAQ